MSERIAKQIIGKQYFSGFDTGVDNIERQSNSQSVQLKSPIKSPILYVLSYPGKKNARQKRVINALKSIKTAFLSVKNVTRLFKRV
jgi:hypothetical protein